MGLGRTIERGISTKERNKKEIKRLKKGKRYGFWVNFGDSPLPERGKKGKTVNYTGQ